MVAIPSTKDTDPEDVVWGLQTAEALWKRGERIDAIVWLRRAAQAAGDAADDDRALELARAAAELSDWMATEPAPGTEPPPAMGDVSPSAMPMPPAGSAPPFPAAPVAEQKPYDPHNAATFVPYDDAQGPGPMTPRTPSAPTYRPEPPLSRPPSSPTIQQMDPFFPVPAAPTAEEMPGLTAPLHDDAEPSATTSVPPAEHVHAGMFNPWDDGALPAAAPAVAPAVDLPFAGEEEVITSVRPQQIAEQRAEALRSQPPAPSSDAPPPERSATVKPAPGRPPPLPARARKPPVPGSATSAAPPGPPMPPSSPNIPRASAAPLAPRAPMAPMAPRPLGAPPSSRALPVASPRPAPVTPVPPSPTQVTAPEVPPELASVPVIMPEPTEPRIEAEASAPELPKVPSSPPVEPVVAPAPSASAAPKLDLDAVEAFSDLPDDARAAFAAAAKVSALAEGEEVSGFALAYMLEGTCDVAATMVDAPAARLAAGAVLRSRGTTDEGVPMRLIGVSSGIVATWTDAEVQDAFRTCPWVEEDLRTAADRMQTLVGVTIGPLGERLDASIREEIISRLTMKTLIAGDVVVTQGEQMVGLILIGVGELELMDGDKVAGVVGSGEFLFATEVLGGGDVPRTARAGAGGALILYGDRHIAQELLVTCPPLLEVFAGM
jgi:hypothetical protein